LFEIQNLQLSVYFINFTGKNIIDIMTKVLGMGNALVDILIRINDEKILEELNMPKGTMHLVEADFAGELLARLTDYSQQLSSGGSAANTIHGLAHLGVETAFIGKVGKDDFGKFFSQDMQNAGIHPQLLSSDTESGRAIALITPDSERTFGTYLGAAIELSAADLKPEMFSGYEYFHIEGYLVQNHELIETAVKMAREAGVKVSLDLASYNVVEDNKDFLLDITRKYVDILFANEEEALAFTGKNPEEAINIISEYCETAIVKTGANGSLVKKGNTIYKIEPVKATSVDTTGAGDLYAAGFIYGLSNGMLPDKCGEIGSLLPGRVIEVMGAKMSDDRWKEVLTEGGL